MRRGLLAGVTGAGLLVLPAPAEAGAWVLPRHRAWVQLSAWHQQTTERYFLDKRRIPYFFEGENRTSALFLDLRYAPIGRLEVGVQTPLYRVQFDDLADRRRSTGIGDVRLGLRYGLVEGGLVATVGAVVKLPTGEFVNDAEWVPVGEGQPDLELTVELAHSFWPRMAYVSGLAGYRLRAENGENGIDPGDELFWTLEAGHRLVGRLNFKAVARGLHGRRSTSFGLEIPTLKREVVYLQPGLTLDLGADRGLEVSFPFTVAGRNWPAGLALGLAFHSRF